MYGILMKEFYNFIKNLMKHEIKREDFYDEEEIYDIVIDNKEDLL
jgi:hypothetical protein